MHSSLGGFKPNKKKKAHKLKFADSMNGVRLLALYQATGCHLSIAAVCVASLPKVTGLHVQSVAGSANMWMAEWYYPGYQKCRGARAGLTGCR